MLKFVTNMSFFVLLSAELCAFGHFYGPVFQQNNNRTIYSWFMHHRSVNSIYLASDNVQTVQICIFINGSTGIVVVKAHTFKNVGI